MPLGRGDFEGCGKDGHLEILQWVREEGCPWDDRICWRAARFGHLEVLQWLWEEECPWNKDVCVWAAQGTHPGVLQWLREEGYPWDFWTCWEASGHGGQFEVLRWAVENGCPYKERDTEDIRDLYFLEWFEGYKRGHVRLFF
mmetsp:Transcript_7564/g.15699  ORF Transcript_7564/g.15699 Transcript_7564/m.15699 type:complete len:142 (-) Transcript_7564:46-471(-)